MNALNETFDDDLAPVLRDDQWYPPEPEPERAPWFFGTAPIPHDGPAGPEGVEQMMAELEQNALLTEMRELLDFIGDGRRLTAAGTLYVVEKKEFHRSSSRAGAGGARNDWYEHRWLDERLDLLCGIGWLEVEERVLRTASVPAIDPLRSGEPSSLLEATRELFASVLRRTLPREPRVSLSGPGALIWMPF